MVVFQLHDSQRRWVTIQNPFKVKRQRSAGNFLKGDRTDGEKIPLGKTWGWYLGWQEEIREILKCTCQI